MYFRTIEGHQNDELIPGNCDVSELAAGIHIANDCYSVSLPSMCAILNPRVSLTWTDTPRDEMNSLWTWYSARTQDPARKHANVVTQGHGTPRRFLVARKYRPSSENSTPSRSWKEVTAKAR